MQRATRVAQLERRLSDLTAQIQAGVDSPRETSEPVVRKRKHAFALDFLFLADNPNGNSAIGGEPAMQQPFSPPSTNAGSPPRDVQAAIWPEGGEAESLLSKYRSSMMSVFPFVIIPEQATSASLRSNHPFTWKALMVQACMDDGHRQQVLGKEVLQELSEALLTKPRKSLDLLQGLILFVAW